MPWGFTTKKRSSDVLSIGGWVGLRTGLGDIKERKFLTLPELELRPLGRSARRQTIYLLG
jgi:hypothetical protein